MHSKQVSDNKKKLNHFEIVINKRLSNTNDKIHVLKEHYQKLGIEKSMLNPLRMNGNYMYNQGLESMKDCLLILLMSI